MHLVVFFQWRHTTNDFRNDLMKDQSLFFLLVGSVVTFRISNVYNVFYIFPVCLAFSFLHPCPYLLVVGYILGAVRGSLFLEEFVSFPLQHLNMLIYPWLTGLVSSKKFLGNKLLNKLMDFKLKVFPERVDK